MGVGDQIRRALHAGSKDGLELAAVRILELAKENIPVGDPAHDPDPNVTLKDSGRIDHPAPNVVEVGFHTPYAAKQHEDQHLKHPRGGGAKYLERALLEELPRLEGIVAGEVHKRMAGTRR